MLIVRNTVLQPVDLIIKIASYQQEMSIPTANNWQFAIIHRFVLFYWTIIDWYWLSIFLSTNTPPDILNMNQYQKSIIWLVFVVLIDYQSGNAGQYQQQIIINIDLYGLIQLFILGFISKNDSIGSDWYLSIDNYGVVNQLILGCISQRLEIMGIWPNYRKTIEISCCYIIPVQIWMSEIHNNFKRQPIFGVDSHAGRAN